MFHRFAFLERDTGKRALTFVNCLAFAFDAGCMLSVGQFAFVGNPPGSWSSCQRGVRLGLFARVRQAPRQFRHGDRRHHGQAIFVLVLVRLTCIHVSVCLAGTGVPGHQQLGRGRAFGRHWRRSSDCHGRGCFHMVPWVVADTRRRRSMNQ
jgi:hypothetical protein